jgi:hypothetical protein
MDDTELHCWIFSHVRIIVLSKTFFTDIRMYFSLSRHYEHSDIS